MSLSIKVFDTILSRNGDSVSRNSADFWKVFCSASGWKFNYERIHSLADLEYFFGGRKKIKEQIIIFSGHGHNESGFILSNGENLNGNEYFEVSPHNREKTLIFSSCLIGKNNKISNQLKDFFGAECLFAYKHIMYDRFCFLNESILLSLIEQAFDKKNSFTYKDFENFQNQTSFMKNMNQENVKTHPMVMF